MDIPFLNDLFCVFPREGILVFKRDYFKRKKGEYLTPSNKGNGYRLIKINGKPEACHRIIWVLCNGEIPEGMVVDHINGNPRDNRISNLRVCTQAQNMINRKQHRNNSSGFKGVYYDPPKVNGRPWRAQIKVNGRKINLGRYNDPQEASAAYKIASEKYHGEFSRFS